MYATGEVAYLLKDWKSVVQEYNRYYAKKVIFTNDSDDIVSKTLFGSVSATASDGTTKGVTSGNADVFTYHDGNGTLIFYSTGTIYFPKDSSDLFNSVDNLESFDCGTNVINTSKVTNMKNMFNSCGYNISSSTSFNLNNVDTSNVTDMSNMFAGCSRLTKLTFPNTFNTINVTDMSGMFSGCQALNSLNISTFNTTNVTNMQSMFSSCNGLEALDLSSFNTAKVTNMNGMFSGCPFISINLSKFDTSKVTNMSNIFDSCWAMTSLNISTFNTANVTNMQSMFYCCSSLGTLDLSNFDMTKCTTSNSVSNMFYNCTSLSEIYSPKNIQVAITLPSGTYYKVTGMAGSYVKDGDAITTIPVGTDSIHILKEVSMTLNANTGAFTGTNTGWTVSAPTATKTGLYGETLDSVSVTKSGYHIESWNTAANGTGTRYELTDAIPTGKTLYAQFAEGVLPVTGVDIGVGTLIASVLATLLIACGLVLVLNKKKRYK